MDSLRDESSAGTRVPRPEKPKGIFRPLNTHGLRRLTREPMVSGKPCGSGSGLQMPAIVELELECGLELTCGQGVES